MATISGAQNERVFSIGRWLGLNESPDGDTKLKLGESPVMRNWRVTRDGNLRKRPGSRCLLEITGYVGAAWSGTLHGTTRTLAVISKKLCSLAPGLDGEWASTELGTISAGVGKTYFLMFEFNDSIYIISDAAMYSYDGTTFSTVTPYIPLVANAVEPSGACVLQEQVNRLTPQRRCRLSPDGNSYTFKLPEKGLISIDSAKSTATGTSVPFVTPTAAKLLAGEIDFSAQPSAGTDTIEVTYTAYAATGLPAEVHKMRYAELYNGSQLNRVFLYGNGTNQTLYSGINGTTGQPDATYFPDLNVAGVGDASEPITSMIRYNSRLLCFKENSTWIIQYGQITLADGNLTAAFYVTPVHGELGGKFAQMVMNSPVAVYQGDVYSWAGNDYGNMTADERQAKRISDRVHRTLSEMSGDLVCYDDNYNQEYYISDRRIAGAGITLVWNYAQDVWYRYEGLRMAYPFQRDGTLYYYHWDSGSGPGHYPSLQAFDPDCPYDAIAGGEPQTIDCYWESGSEPFRAEYQRKYSAMLWVGMKPEPYGQVWVTVATERSSQLNEKLVQTSYFSFINFNFSRINFDPVKNPRMTRLKIKAKKFIYYKLILKTDTDDSTATVTAADFRVRFTGYAK